MGYSLSGGSKSSHFDPILLDISPFAMRQSQFTEPFPLDIAKIIFEIAIRTDPSCTGTLRCISSPVKEWITPLHLRHIYLKRAMIIPQPSFSPSVVEAVQMLTLNVHDWSGYRSRIVKKNARLELTPSITTLKSVCPDEFLARAVSSTDHIMHLIFSGLSQNSWISNGCLFSFHNLSHILITGEHTLLLPEPRKQALMDFSKSPMRIKNLAHIVECSTFLIRHCPPSLQIVIVMENIIEFPPAEDISPNAVDFILGKLYPQFVLGARLEPLYPIEAFRRAVLVWPIMKGLSNDLATWEGIWQEAERVVQQRMQ
ncbi:hypothetical protein DL96DRAFT_1631107 [Flagelloscypha sp. PMI_526]|nr:hypothetical protein DL96DRAFT_1631107 [Flagelloscypha sp. PMI_526]